MPVYFINTLHGDLFQKTKGLSINNKIINLKDNALIV